MPILNSTEIPSSDVYINLPFTYRNLPPSPYRVAEQTERLSVFVTSIQKLMIEVNSAYDTDTLRFIIKKALGYYDSYLGNKKVSPEFVAILAPPLLKIGEVTNSRGEVITFLKRLDLACKALDIPPETP